MVTAYDAPFAQAAESAGVDIILVGDSLANVLLGKNRTTEIEMSTMKIFVQAVCAGSANTHITADMPFGSYATAETALKNARVFVDLGAHSVKLEGCKPKIIQEITSKGIPVMGHLGLLPQTAVSLKQVGNNESEKKELTTQAREIQGAGIFSLVLEHLDYGLARAITKDLDVPTIGIGAGPDVNGQVLVLHDMLGIHNKPLPPFARKFADLYEMAVSGISDYVSAVKKKTFP